MRGSAIPPPEAQDQFGLFTAGQAMAAGYSSYRIRRLVRDRRWVVVLGSVYVETATPLSQASLARAGLLAAGTGSAVSHCTAGRLWDLRLPPDPDIHVTVDPRVHLRIAGLRAHRIPLTEADLDVRSGILCTGLLRTVIDCMLWLAEEAGRALVVDALRRRLVGVEELRRGLLRTGQRHGLSRAWRIMRDVGRNAHSEAEARVHRLFTGAGITGWRANVPVDDGAGLIGVVDVLFDDVPLVVEVDGRAYHSEEDRFQRDRSRQNRLVLAGYTVLRFTWHDIAHRPDELIRQVRATRQALRARGTGSATTVS
jgi:very-short-patch-repair endonuclease